MARKGGKDRGLFERPKGSGVWWINYVGSDRREHIERGGTKTDARALLARRKTEIADGTWKAPYGHGAHAVNGSRRPAAASTLTLGAFARRWLEERAPHLTPQVGYNYRGLVTKWLLPHRLARMTLKEISDGDIATLVNELRRTPGAGGRPLSPGRINAVLKLLRSVFRVARRRKLVADNPMEYVDRLREPRPEVDPLDLNEVSRLLSAALGWERSFLTVLLFTGMRPGEVLALTWNALDWEHNLIRVRRTFHPRYGFGLPKTPGSEREVEMSGTVRAALMEQRARAQLRGELVFPSEAGTPVNLQNFRTRNWPRILRRAKVRPRVLYHCRHTFVRLALEHGDHPQHIAAMLGHVSTEMVFKRYGRWMQRPESTALARLDAAMRAKAGRDSGQDSGLKTTEVE